MNYGEWKISIVDKGYDITNDVFIYRHLHNGTTDILGVGIIKQGEIANEPTLRLLPEQLQAFSDALNKIGYKPQKGFLEGKLESTERHLEDMRSLVFKKKTANPPTSGEEK